MNTHRCQDLLRNSSLLVLALTLSGCNPSPSEVRQAGELPTWSFQEVTWHQTEGEFRYQFNAQTLEHYPKRTEATELSFSYNAPQLRVEGTAQRAKFSPNDETVDMFELRLTSRGLGQLESARGMLRLREKEMDLTTVVSTLESPKLRMVTPSAKLLFESSDALYLETSAVEGTTMLPPKAP